MRLDAYMASIGLVYSRSQAQRLISSGRVHVDGRLVSKPSFAVDEHSTIDVDKGADYVSRGAYKLEGAFERFSAVGLKSPQGRKCLDIGASTGGFCDVLLRRGAETVIALDVGHDQLDPRIASDSRIIEMSGVNIRDICTDDLPYQPSLIVSDVSFISLTYVLPVAAEIAAPNADTVLLVKPQFEVGKGHLGKNGIVEDPELRQAALNRVCDCAQQVGFNVRGACPSPISGTHGNNEYLLYATLR
ncbi:23S rRNA (cytidine1920-2'-O)/16S rRNA (cytidine1409-2'-O)-methyltransferase [Bifidobacterium commune]|uniref:23S rRNA (Cytidine1920-2'-O)/16S rRNA (Cytidine1409-2'-O)-methyltransferase n=1 Tax=Bifidobacterium commune TaxID=1505727 RepID=A0A1C4H195_9BIFI|nr:TlyA family RNA methyltransferase [Bifidobacterium commune]MBB2954742.1 23S rRNA (cytidine1920-2'-O)/16S rRNA (cytidine1409-2'-O)-methyltransferase [Bifidobacterium commune]SCC78681.1 23S rRNA (cytidine1920-2'-O)/16S rRNA (cytidine1409-2'-O)-methyltransferase [Bifidobacterium commune]